MLSTSCFDLEHHVGVDGAFLFVHGQQHRLGGGVVDAPGDAEGLLVDGKQDRADCVLVVGRQPVRQQRKRLARRTALEASHNDDALAVGHQLDDLALVWGDLAQAVLAAADRAVRTKLQSPVDPTGSDSIGPFPNGREPAIVGQLNGDPPSVKEGAPVPVSKRVPLRLLAARRSKKRCPLRTALSRPASHRRSKLSWDQETGTGGRSLFLTLADLGVDKSHSRPRVSNDNPFSEAQFRTLKYMPEYPDRFGCFRDALSFCRAFFRWYNTEHRHSGIGMLTPEMVHYGRAEQVLARRHRVRMAAYTAHPERFVGGEPKRVQLPQAVWINPPRSLLKDDRSAVELVIPGHQVCSTSKAEPVAVPPVQSGGLYMEALQ